MLFFANEDRQMATGAFLSASSDPLGLSSARIQRDVAMVASCNEAGDLAELEPNGESKKVTLDCDRPAVVCHM